MKIRNKPVNDLKLISRINKDIRIPAARANSPVLLCRGFQRSAAGGADGNHTAASLFCLRNFPGGFAVDAVPLGMHFMVKDILLFHGAKRA